MRSALTISLKKKTLSKQTRKISDKKKDFTHKSNILNKIVQRQKEKEMDQIFKNSIKKQSEFKIISNETTYLGLLELIDQRVKITLTLGLSQFKWSGINSIEQLQKLSGIFMVCNSIEDAYEYLKEILIENSFEVQRDQEKIILKFNQKQFNLKVTFNIQLAQEEVSTNDVMSALYNSISEMQKEIDELKISQKSQDEVINSQQKKMKEQDEVINSHKNEIEELKNNMKQMQEENQKQIIELQKQVFPLLFTDTKILSKKDVEKLGEWIDQGKKKMELKLIYRATTHGFEITKFYEKCANITPTLIVIETTNNKRFGGYTELLWNINSSWVVSNPNKSFLFSLDLNKKYTSNEPNCQYAIYASSNNYAFGGGHDLTICNNSNTQNGSYVGGGSYYGKNEGISTYDLNGENKNFLTKEIEVFQVLLN